MNQERQRFFSGATPSLTRVWTLGRLEAGCFYFHVLQHQQCVQNGVSMIRRHTGETALRGDFIAPAFLPLLRRGRSTGMNRMQAQTRPSVSESTVMLKASFVPPAVNETEMFSGRAAVHKQIPGQVPEIWQQR